MKFFQRVVRNAARRNRKMTRTPQLESLEHRFALAQVSIAGHAGWAMGIDDHPTPLATVYIMQKDGNRYTLLARTQTNEAGNYQANVNIVPPARGAVTVVARIFTKSTYADILTAEDGTFYADMSPDLRLNANAIAKPTVKRIPDAIALGSAAHAFGAHSAIVMAGQFAEKSSGRAMASLRVIMNTSIATTQYIAATDTVEVKTPNGYDWDVVQHEYGHYFADIFQFAPSSGGPHSFGQHNSPELAFSEAFATFFALAAQDYMSDKVYARSVPRIGDSFYSDTFEGVNVDLATSKGVGEDDELSVGSFLYHLNAADQTYDIQSTALIRKFIAHKPSTVGEVWGILGGGASFETKARLGAMLADQRIASEEVKPANNTAIGVTPKFVWRNAGEPGHAELEEFTIAFYNDELTNLIDKISIASPVHEPDGNLSFTPDPSVWLTIKLLHETVRWVIEGKSTVEYASPKGRLTTYWSQANLLGVQSQPFVQTRTTLSLAGVALQSNLPNLVGFLAVIRLNEPVQLFNVSVSVNWGDGSFGTNGTLYLLPHVGPNYFGLFNDHVYANDGPPDTIAPKTVDFIVHANGYKNAIGTTTAFVSYPRNALKTNVSN